MSEWNIDTLKEYIDRILQERNERFVAIKEAVNKAEAATEKRFEGVNEFRSQLSDQSRTFIPRSETESMFKSLERQITDLKTNLERLKNVKAGSQVVWAYIIAAISLMIAISGGIMTFYNSFIKH